MACRARCKGLGTAGREECRRGYASGRANNAEVPGRRRRRTLGSQSCSEVDTGAYANNDEEEQALAEVQRDPYPELVELRDVRKKEVVSA